MKKLNLDDKNIYYMGRIDFENPKSPTFIWAGSLLKFRFIGTDIDISLKNTVFADKTHIGYLIDGIQYKLELDKNESETKYPLAKDLENTEHEIIIFKRMDATHYFTLTGIYINDDAKLLPITEKPKRRIEIFGDSVSCGAVVEAVNYEAHIDPENQDGRYDNAWFSYSMITARLLNAELHNTSQGGIAVLDKTGYFEQPVTTGLVSTYDKLRYSPRAKTSQWNFNKYIPHVVIMAVGQNDSFPNPDCLKDKNYYENWVANYINIVKQLKKNYPKAVFILTTTVLCHDEIWDKAIDDIALRLNDKSVYRFYYTRCGKATPGHPRITEQAEMAAELTAFIKTLPDNIWDN